MNKTSDPVPGVVQELQPGLHRILAPNPSPMTYWGTNTYLVGTDTLAVIDPGPAKPAHLESILSAVAGRKVSHIFVTHSHRDHSPLAAPLAKATGAPVLAFGDSFAGQSPVMRALSDAGLTQGGEGVDAQFQPDQRLNDGEEIKGDGWALRAIHTPGHMGNHLCFAWEDAVFTGDLVMGWASSMVSPPDGDLSDFMTSCRRLQALPASRFYPGHGAPVQDPQNRLRWLLVHREQRTAQILTALESGAQDVTTLTRAIYADAPPDLLLAAARNVFAHLIDLHESGTVQASPTLSAKAVFALAGAS